MCCFQHETIDTFLDALASLRPMIEIKTQSQLLCSFQSQSVSKILSACSNFGKVNG